MPVILPTPPTPPSLSDPANFDARTDAFLAWMTDLGVTWNASPPLLVEDITTLWSAARRTKSTVQSIPDGVFTIIAYDTLDYDKLGELDATGRFTAQNDGIYHISASLISADVIWATGKVWLINLYKNGLSYANGFRTVANAALTENFHSTLDTDMELVAGDYIDIRAYTRVETADTFPDFRYNYFSVHRVA